MQNCSLLKKYIKGNTYQSISVCSRSCYFWSTYNEKKNFAQWGPLDITMSILFVQTEQIGASGFPQEFSYCRGWKLLLPCARTLRPFPYQRILVRRSIHFWSMTYYEARRGGTGQESRGSERKFHKPDDITHCQRFIKWTPTCRDALFILKFRVTHPRDVRNAVPFLHWRTEYANQEINNTLSTRKIFSKNAVVCVRKWFDEKYVFQGRRGFEYSRANKWYLPTQTRSAFAEGYHCSRAYLRLVRDECDSESGMCRYENLAKLSKQFATAQNVASWLCCLEEHSIEFSYNCFVNQTLYQKNTVPIFWLYC